MELGRTRPATVSITRPNDVTAYAAGDVVGPTGATAVLKFEGLGNPKQAVRLDRLEFAVHDSALIASEAAYRLHLFNALPTVYADNAAFDIAAADRAAYCGFIDITTPVDYGATLWMQMSGLNMQVQLGADRGLWAYLVTIAGYTPSALRAMRLRLFATQV
jgi:hypothetical protein